MTKTDLEFENESVLNPAAIRQGDSVHLFYRAVRSGNHSSIDDYRLDGPLTVPRSCNMIFKDSNPRHDFSLPLLQMLSQSEKVSSLYPNYPF